MTAVDREHQLSFLVSGLQPDGIRMRFAIAAVDAILGADSVPDLSGHQSELRAFLFEHRVQSIANRLWPGLGGQAVTSLAGAVRMEQRLVESIHVLRSAGVEALVLKGSATSQLDHRYPSDREVGDIDLLVRPDESQAAIDAMVGAGFEIKPTHPFRTRRFFHSETLEHPDGTEIDLHTRFHQVSVAPLTCWHAPDRFILGGYELQALPASWRFTHALVHQVMNPPPAFRGLNGLLDLAVMAPKISAAEVRVNACEIGLTAVVEHGLRRLSSLLGIDFGSPASTRRSHTVSQRYADASDSNEPIPGHLSLIAALAVHRKRDWPRYLGELAWPSADYREALGVTARWQLAHICREAIGLPSPPRRTG